jgi:3-phytase
MLCGLVCLFAATAAAAAPVHQSFQSPTSIDQDDMCLWIHPEDTALSLVVASDKYSGMVYVYDLDGTHRQTIVTGKPGNIDVRYGFSLGGDCVDLVAFNERDQYRLLVYRVDPAQRVLVRVDDGNIDIGSNYGMTLQWHSNGSLFAYTGPKSSPITQYMLVETTGGQITGVPTGWSVQLGTVEGMAGDDETGYVYLCEEQAGIWRVDALDANHKVMIASSGDGSGLQSDVEGITLYYAPSGQGYLIASSQGASHFTVFQRAAPHAPVGNFELGGVGATDGIDVVSLPLSAAFPSGIFLAHNGSDPATLVAAQWDAIVAELPALQSAPGYWDPRSCGTTTSRGPDASVPAPAVLHTSVPNPFNPSTTLVYEVLAASRVRLQIHDVTGRVVRTLLDAPHSPGEHRVTWDGRDHNGREVAGGLYLCRLDAGGFSRTIKLTLVR